MSAAPKMSIEEMIRHYQRSIERSQNDPHRLLHCLNKLRRMDVTVEHLQATGIGRTVNVLRKDDGDVGSFAKSLISKWKQMVQSEPNEQNENGKIGSDQEDSVDKSHKSNRHSKSHNPSKNKSSSSRDHSKHNSLHNHSDHYAECKIDNNDVEVHSSRKRSRDSERPNGHKRSNSTEKLHRKTEQSHSSERSNDAKKFKYVNNEYQKRNNESDRVTPSSTSHETNHGHDFEHISSSKKQHCDADSTTSPSFPHQSKVKKMSKSKQKSSDDSFEIDHSTGTSFEDALGMIEPLSKIKTSSSSGKSRITSKLPETTPQNSHHEKKRTTPSTSTSSNSSKSKTPALLTQKVKLPPLDDISIELPPPLPPSECFIRNDYKPSPVNPLILDVVYRSQKPSTMNEAAALCASTTSKNQRTKVYSGTKSGQLLNVPSLHELCIRFLQKNIDALEYTGGVPFEILRPVLERATPNQLYTFEHFNPYLMDDSDILWQQHCKNKFKTYKRQEMETWREMYARCEKEQEDRLNSLANNIKKSQSVAIPVRQTKLAYVDSAVKPPRGIAKKQNQFGTQSKLVATPAARVDALSSIASNIARVGDARLRTTAAMRDTAQAQSSNGSLKPKKAPLMMKSLQLLKGRFKR